MSGWNLTLGARPEAGGVRFRVWAPTAEHIAVVLYGPDAERVEPLRSAANGYFDGLVEGIGPGARYRYRLDGKQAYPDPASRSQPDGVHGPSEVVDPSAYRWRATDWSGIALADLVIYELHIGTFTPAGTFEGAEERIDAIAALGATAIELMPIGNFAGARNWGYDEVNLFAPATAYGGVDAFKRLVDRAHELGLAVILDVVYSHLGPEGNYLGAVTGGRFFTDRHRTPWGDAINFDGPGSGAVRDFVVQNALYWLVEYELDGLRLDAVHAIIDDSERHILGEIADQVRQVPGRYRVLIAEAERHATRAILPPGEGGFGCDAVWADDLHHHLRRLVCGDCDGYFADYTGKVEDIAETLRSGWWPDPSGPAVTLGAVGSPTPTGDVVPPTRFVYCIQNHDQVGNRATGERLNHETPAGVYRALSTLLLTSPSVPLLWMGQEWAASSPFLYFTDHPEEVGRLVSEGRRNEFRDFAAFSHPERHDVIPDPQAWDTFDRSRLRWEEREEPPHAQMLALYRALIGLRRSHPALRPRTREASAVTALGEGALALRRTGLHGEEVVVVVNLLGEIRTQLSADRITRPPEGGVWCPLICTEEVRFGGDGGWGTVEADGTLHLVQPVALVLECRRA